MKLIDATMYEMTEVKSAGKVSEITRYWSHSGVAYLVLKSVDGKFRTFRHSHIIGEFYSYKTALMKECEWVNGSPEYKKNGKQFTITDEETINWLKKVERNPVRKSSRKSSYEIYDDRGWDDYGSQAFIDADIMH